MGFEASSHSPRSLRPALGMRALLVATQSRTIHKDRSRSTWEACFRQRMLLRTPPTHRRTHSEKSPSNPRRKQVRPYHPCLTRARCTATHHDCKVRTNPETCNINVHYHHNLKLQYLDDMWIRMEFTAKCGASKTMRIVSIFAFLRKGKSKTLLTIKSLANFYSTSACPLLSDRNNADYTATRNPSALMQIKPHAGKISEVTLCSRLFRSHLSPHSLLCGKTTKVKGKKNKRMKKKTKQLRLMTETEIRPYSSKAGVPAANHLKTNSMVERILR